MYKDNFTVSIGDEKIECNSFSLNDYTKLLFARSSEDSRLIKHWMNEILKTHTTMIDFTKHKAELVIVHLIAKSLNEKIPVQEYVCECGNEIETPININQTYIDYNKSNEKLVYAFKNFKIKLKYPQLFEDDNVADMLIKSIEAVYVSEERIELDDLSENELNDLYNAILPSDMDNIANILLEPKVKLGVSISCKKCGKNHVHAITGFKEFIRILE